jgi:hypothetical protein
VPCANTQPDPRCEQGVRYWELAETWREGDSKGEESRWEADRRYRHAKMVYDGHAATCSRTR